MRSSWTGTISFSLISLPVKLESIVSAKNEIPAHQYAPDGSRIRYKRVSELDSEKEIAYADIRKGYDAPDGGIVFLTDKEVSEALGPVSREARILMTTDTARVPDIAKSKPFLLEPGKGGKKPYALLARGLTRTGKVAIVEIGLSQRKRLAVVSPTASGFLMLQMLEWAEDIQQPDFLAPDDTFSEAEENLAVELVNALSADFDHSAVHDDSAIRLAEMIAARAGGEGQLPGVPVTSDPVAQAEDLIATLAASIEASKAARTEAATGAPARTGGDA